MDLYLFRSHFEQGRYTGKSTMRSLKSGGKSTIYTASSASSAWENAVFEKLKYIQKTAKVSFEEVFLQHDKHNTGVVSLTEFRNALRKLNLALTSREIDRLAHKFDVGCEGNIDWRAFSTKFGQR